MRTLSFLQSVLLAQDSYGGEYGTPDISSFAQRVQTVVKEHTELYVYKLVSDRYALVFQGSNGTADWLDDLFTFLWPRKRIKTDIVLIHAGFALNYEPIEHAVEDLVAQYGVENVEFVGHSLGAANARRARFEMKLKYKVDVPTFMFGEPNGGNHEYYEICDGADAYSFQNNDDAVANVPWRIMGFAKPKRIKISDGPKSWAGLRAKLLAWVGNCNSHYPQKYVQAIINYEKEHQ